MSVKWLDAFVTFRTTQHMYLGPHCRLLVRTRANVMIVFVSDIITSPYIKTRLTVLQTVQKGIHIMT